MKNKKPPTPSKANKKIAKTELKQTASSVQQPLWVQVQAKRKNCKIEPIYSVESPMEFNAWKALKANLKFPGMTPEQVRQLCNNKGQNVFNKLISDAS